VLAPNHKDEIVHFKLEFKQLEREKLVAIVPRFMLVFARSILTQEFYYGKNL